MSLHARRLLPAVALAAALLGGASAHAQIGGFLKKKIPKIAVPGAPAPAPAVNERPKYCAAITDEVLDRFLKGLEAENAAIARREEAEQRVNAAGNAAARAAELMTPEGFAKFEACKEAAAAQDPRTKDRDRLRGLADAAARKVETRKYQEYSAQADELDELIDAAAEKACGGGPKALLAAAGERADTKAAAAAMMDDAGDADEQGWKAGGFTEQEYARLKECVIGRLATPGATPTTPESAAAIDKRAAELEKALPVK